MNHITKALREEVVEYLENVRGCYSRDGQFNAYVAPISTAEIREGAAVLLEKLLGQETEKCDGCKKTFPKGSLIRDSHDSALLYCGKCLKNMSLGNRLS